MHAADEVNSNQSISPRVQGDAPQITMYQMIKQQAVQQRI
jgi:hypothetical protein